MRTVARRRDELTEARRCSDRQRIAFESGALPKDRDGPFDEVAFAWAEDRVARLPQWRSLDVDGYKRLRAELGIPPG